MSQWKHGNQNPLKPFGGLKNQKYAKYIRLTKLKSLEGMVGSINVPCAANSQLPITIQINYDKICY